MSRAWLRVSKAMVQMFGPQWTDKFGQTNEEWEKALERLEYGQISVGLSKVRNGALKYFEIDLPRFIDLCKPPPAPRPSFEVEPPAYMKDMCEREQLMHRFATAKLLVWCCRHKKYGINANDNFSKQQNTDLFNVSRRIAHDFFLMREEMGDEAVPDSDFLIALQRNWSKIAKDDE